MATLDVRPLRAELVQDGEIGLTLPQEILDQFGISEGTLLHLVATPDGLLIKKATAHEQAVADAADRAEAQYDNAFRDLAK